MKRILIFASVLLLSMAVGAGEKVIESSSRKAPQWIGGMEDGYFIVSAQAATIEDAQQKAMTQIREQIVAAIATNVHSATSITMHEVTTNGSIDSHKEMISNLSVKAADIPYLANVSPSHAEDYYWTKIRRKDKSTYYYYHVKYPFSNSKLRMLVDEYEKQQKLINDSIQGFASTDFATYDDLDRMLLRHSMLKQYTASLRQDDPRITICNTIRQTYEQMLSRNLHIEISDATRTQAAAQLLYGDKPVNHSMMPKTKSNCLTAIEVKKGANADIISYDYQTGCYEEEQNYIELIYTVLGKKITQRTYIK